MLRKNPTVEDYPGIAHALEMLKADGIKAYPNTVLRYIFCFQTAEQTAVFNENFVIAADTVGKCGKFSSHNISMEAEDTVEDSTFKL